jgi:NAD(P)-dependent dehydrogenase (short-subunit alcohol dehydrogenase family)
MHIDLSSRTAGIGLAVAKGLAGAGAYVVVTGRTRARVDGALVAIGREFPHATLTGVAADLGTEAGAAQLIAAVPEADILVNNLGIFEPKPFFDIPDADWQRFFEVNVMSGVRLSRHYAQGMAGRGWGASSSCRASRACRSPPRWSTTVSPRPRSWRYCVGWPRAWPAPALR